MGGARGWRGPYAQLRALFHTSAERRREGALALQQLLWAAEDDACAAAETADRAAGYRARSAEAWTDPLAAVLNGGSGYAEGAAGDAASSGGRPRRVPPMKEVQELVAVVCNVALGAETRRAAAQQLTALAAHPMTGASLVASPPLLPLLLRTVTAVAAVRVHEHAVDDDEEANGDGATTSAAAAAAARLGRPTLQPGYSSFAPLAHAALELMTTLVLYQRAAQGWLMSPESAVGGGGSSPSKGGTEATPRVLRLLHLVFHRNVTVRRAVAQTLGRLLFHPCVLDPSGSGSGSALREQAEEEQQEDETKATPTTMATIMRLPMPFVTMYRFPFATSAAAPYATRARPGAVAEAPHDAAEAQRVGRMAALRRLIRSLNDGEHPTAEAARLGELLREAAAVGGGGDDEDVGSPLPELTADAAATLIACGADEALPRALEALSSARSHAAAAAALAALRLRAASAATATALAAQDWPTAVGRFLATTPASSGDHKLWVELLELVRKPTSRLQISETLATHRFPNPRLKIPLP